MLFSDLSDSTRIAASMETEYYAELLGYLRRIYTEVIPKFGGTIVQIQGDGVLAIFGYPDAREDSGRQATEAALALHHSVRELHVDMPVPRTALTLHSGVHSGLVLFDEGDLVRGRFEMLGDATNIASRLSDAAEAGEILVSEETLGPESHFFQTSGCRPLLFKGNDEPINVYRILARASIGSRFEALARRGLVPFVGRQTELRALEGNLQDVIAGNSRYAAIVAPAGLGKTRLVEEFLRHAASLNCQIHRGYYENYLSAEPLQPFLQMLRTLFGIDHGMSANAATAAIQDTLSSIDPELSRHQGELLRVLSIDTREASTSDASRVGGENTIAAMLDLFDRLAEKSPVVLFIDDWQWADDATRLLVGAMRSMERRAVMVVIATREFTAGDPDMNGARILELAPFTEEESAATIRQLLPRIDPFLVTEIHRYSGGNPLYIEEMSHSAAHGDSDERLRHGRGGTAWLTVMIESRVARLPNQQIEVVRAAAVIGNVIPCWLLKEIAGCDEEHPLVRGLAERDFIFPGEEAGTLRFKHGITRDVIYDAVGLHQRRAMHLRIAKSLQQRGSIGAGEEAYEALAYHYQASGQYEEAAHFAELAGDKAAFISALDRAQAQYLAALAALDMLEPSRNTYLRWISISQRLAKASVFDPSREPLKELQRSVTLARTHEDQDAIAKGEFWLANVNYALGEARVAISHCERALEAAKKFGDNKVIVQIRTTMGQAEAAACEYDRSLPLLEEAIEIQRKHRSSARPAVGLSYTLTCKGSVLGDQGLFPQAHACFEEALEAVSGSNHGVKGSILCWRSAVYLWQGRWDDAQRCAVEAERVAERVRSRYLYAMSRALAAFGSWMTTRRIESLQAIVEATTWIEAHDRVQYISLNYGWLADAMVANGQFSEARNSAAWALARGRKGDRLGEAMACRAMARASARGIGRRSAHHYLALAMNAACERGSPHEIAVTQLCHAELMHACGDRVRAEESLREATSGFARMEMAWHLDEASRLRRAL
jgi:class 3 adenylate cyclase/tetratricopeptide (TPR) repeat protein